MKFNGRSGLGGSLAVLATAALVTGCGGGGGSGGTPTPQNAPPTLSPLTAQTVDQDTPTPAQAFTVSDDGGVNAVIVVASSSDPNVLPRYGLKLGGSGANRTITVIPAEDATGTANVTVTASDARGAFSSVVFPVTVNAVSRSFAGYSTAAFAQQEGDTPAQVSGITFVQDADDEATFAPLLQ
jgi:hypothetical protein